jgi:hypothetical protein
MSLFFISRNVFHFSTMYIVEQWIICLDDLFSMQQIEYIAFLPGRSF